MHGQKKSGQKKYAGSSPRISKFPRSTKAVPGKATHKAYRQNTVAKPGKATLGTLKQKTGDTLNGFYTGKQKREWSYIDSVVNQ